MPKILRRARRQTSGGSGNPPEPSTASRSRVWFWGAALVVLAAVVVGATKLDWPSVIATLAKTDPLFFATACGCFALLPVLMAAEWRLIGARSSEASGGMRTLLPVGCFAYFVQIYLNAAVAYAGAMLRLVRARGWTIGQGLGLVTVDQLAEGIARALFCGTVLFIAAGGVSVGSWSAVAVGAAALAALVFVALRGKTVIRRLVTTRLKRAGHAVEVLEEVLAIMSLRAFAWAITLASAKKVAKIAAVAAIEQALGTGGSLWSAVYFVAVLECATTLPLVPGNLGVIESAAVTVYASQGVSAEAGLSIGILYRAGVHLATALMAAAGVTATWAAATWAAAGDSGAQQIELGENDDDDAAEPALPRSQAA
jgi:uncharacterized membrane protein YbhN (UPF0104 family)